MLAYELATKSYTVRTTVALSVCVCVCVLPSQHLFMKWDLLFIHVPRVKTDGVMSSVIKTLL